MGGAYASLTASEIIFGYESDVTAKLNEGDFFEGNLWQLSNYTTPILNDQIGQVANATYGLFSGSNSISRVSQIRLVND